MTDPFLRSNILPLQDFRFGFLAAMNYTPSHPLWDRFFSFPSRATPAIHEGASSAPSEQAKTGNCLIFNEFSNTSPPLPPSAPSFRLPAANLYPVGSGSAAIRRTMLPNSRRVR
jgi:hypothetical protein